MKNLPFLRTRSIALKITKAVLFTQDNECSQVLPSPADEQIHAEKIRESLGSLQWGAKPHGQIISQKLCFSLKILVNREKFLILIRFVLFCY